MDWRILAFVTVLCWGTYNVVLKAVAGRVAWQSSMLWFVIGYGVMVAAYCLTSDPGLLKGRFMTPAAFWPLLAGVLCGIGAIAFFKALPLAPGSVLMPLIGLYVLVSAAGCLIFLHEPLTWRVVAGIGCATAAVMLLGR
ncbi:MAG: EamA family transporter [Kiritimatiellia bacterium]|nr:EamA family transporter [Kiritimatiellia bacterium]